MGKRLNFTILFLIFTAMFIPACDKENTGDEGVNVNYKIYLDNQNRFIKVIEGSENTTSYQYTDSTIKITDPISRHTYFINDLGLADSCLVEEYHYGGWYSPIMCYYKYYKDGSMEFNGEGLYWYKYAEGNRTEAIQDSSLSEYDRREYYYTYTSLPNTIDLESLRGPYMGKLNKNLISKLTYDVGSILKDANIEFSYILDSKNYVKKRTEILTAIGIPTTKTIRNYQYIFLDN
jgi:hypothetical protein